MLKILFVLLNRSSEIGNRKFEDGQLKRCHYEIPWSWIIRPVRPGLYKC